MTVDLVTGCDLKMEGLPMTVHIDYLATFSLPSRAKIERAFLDSVDTFFKHLFNFQSLEISFLIIKAKPNGEANKIIKVVKRTRDFNEINRSGVPVSVWAEGTQGIVCLINIKGMKDSEIEELVNSGPYNRKPRVKKVERHTPAPETAIPNAEQPKPEPKKADTVKVDVTPATGVSSASVETKSASKPGASNVASGIKKILTPHEKLVDAGIPEEEINRLKATMASIVYREYGNSDIPDTIVVSVKTITKATLEHMKLRSRPKGKGGYRGIIANFYVTRIALFGIKDQKSIEPNAVYTDWLIDARLVLDFVGGKDSLACLTRKRDAEVEERLKKEGLQKTPPPTAKEVEKAAESFIEDAALLDLMSKMLEGKAVAEEDLANAVTNRNLLSLEVMKLEQALILARKDLSEADLLVKSSETEVAKFILDEKTRKRMEEIKEKIGALFRGLGM